jgi:uncharacterized protein YjbI with pentapeptide repeats
MRWLTGGIAGVVLLVAIAWVLYVPIADWLAHHDVGSTNASLHETAVDNARGRLLTLGAGLFAAAALVFTGLNFNLVRRTSERTDQWQQRTYEQAEQGQVADRYTKAIEQIGSDKPDVRIGGIYALERIARDSDRDHPTVVEVLSAFVREHSREQRPPVEPGRETPRRATRPDVQAALIVLARRDPKRDVRTLDLFGADLNCANLSSANLGGAQLNGTNLQGTTLAHADLSEASLEGADLTAADLTGADLPDARLTGAHLAGADLTEANLSEANLDGADLTGADLTDAYLRSAGFSDANITGAYLAGAFLNGADLTEANLGRADLTNAHLFGANLTATNLTRANLSRADLSRADLSETNLSEANLTGATWPKDVPVPEGWKRDTSSGQLVSADTGSGPAEAN